MLRDIIIDRIRRDGPISFKDFMEMALYYPEYGYYTSPETEIGIKGDFYTGPHLHPIFGALIGKQIEEMWDFMGQTSEFHIIEYAAGKGYLATDMLDYLKRSRFYSAIRYAIIEINPYLRKKQSEVLKSFSDKITFYKSIDEIDDIKGCVLSNELIDSFPVHLIQKVENTIKEIYVGVESDDFTEVLFEYGSDILSYMEAFNIDITEGYKTEVNTLISNWLSSLSNVLSEGFIFTVDYGYPSWDYYSPARNRGTLQCYYRHMVNENPYQNIGKQDITAHVNFSALEKWGDENGFRTIGYCPQGKFLVSLGIDELLSDIFHNNPDYSFEAAKVKGLIFPEGMGESHKVLIQYRGNGKPDLRGFSLRNQMGDL